MRVRGGVLLIVGAIALGTLVVLQMVTQMRRIYTADQLPDDLDSSHRSNLTRINHSLAYRPWLRYVSWLLLVCGVVALAGAGVAALLGYT